MRGLWPLDHVMIATLVVAPPALAQAVPLNDMANLLDELKGYVTDANSASAADGYVKGRESQIANELGWSGERGALVEVRVERQPNTGVTAVLGNPIVIGIGSRPSEVLSRVKDELLPGPRAGFLVDQEKGIYLWVTRSPDGTLQYTTSHFPLTAATRQEAARLKGERHLLVSMTEERRARILQNVIREAGARAAERSAQQSISEAADRVFQTDQRVKALEEKLRTEMRKAARSKAFADKVALLKNIVTVASLAAEAQSEFASRPDEYTAITDAGVLERRVREYSITKDGITRTYRIEFTKALTDHDNSIDILAETLRPLQAPDSLLEEFNSPSRPRDKDGAWPMNESLPLLR